MTRSGDLALGPATRLMWRTPDSVHLELGDRAVVVDGLPPALVRRVASPVASSDPRPAVDDSVATALAALREAGYLWPRHPEPADDPRLAAPRPRLAGELAALAAVHGERAAEVLSARRHAAIQIRGTSRLAAHVGAVLAAAGVGRIDCTADGTARLAGAVPGGLTPSDEGALLVRAMEDAVLRAAPDADTTPLGVDERPDLVLVTGDGPLDEDRLAALHATGGAYLALTVGIDGGVIGPLVLPGLTSCLNCADLHRADRDPAWSALAVQLTVGRRHGPASPVAAATVLAGAAAHQALTFLDGGEPDCLDATLELHLPDYRLRRRSRPPHPACACTGEPVRHNSHCE